MPLLHAVGDHYCAGQNADVASYDLDAMLDYLLATTQGEPFLRHLIRVMHEDATNTASLVEPTLVLDASADPNNGDLVKVFSKKRKRGVGGKDDVIIFLPLDEQQMAQ